MIYEVGKFSSVKVLESIHVSNEKCANSNGDSVCNYNFETLEPVVEVILYDC